MTTIYAESSAVLRWLLGHSGAATIQSRLASASSIVTSTLTTVEVGRSLRRLSTLGQLSAADRDRVLAIYATAAGHWKVHAVTDAVLDRAVDAFPMEPLRSLDAIHLATAIVCHREIPIDAVLSTDERVRDNAKALGFALSPATPQG